MGSDSAVSDFKVANPHALSAILEASETRSIIASSDIFDINGMKLWARDQPVSAALQRKLMDRALQQPIETCLMMEDGINHARLQNDLKQLFATPGALPPLLLPHADALLQCVNHIRLHPVAQLLLSIAEASRPCTYDHAIQAMAVMGVLVRVRNPDERLVTMAMTAGLLHDIGEMYISPQHGESETLNTLDVESYKQLVIHPHVGQLLISQLTDYPKDIARAIGEHHERLDGSGYPHRLTRDRISVLGKLLAATEEALAALRLPGANLHHASVALRVVPGEFDELLAGPLSAAARRIPPMKQRRSLPELLNELDHLNSVLQRTLSHVDMTAPHMSGPSVQRATELTRHLLYKLRAGWNACGLWNPGAIGDEVAAEVEAVQEALKNRLLLIERVARLTAGTNLTQEDEAALDALCDGLINDI